MHEFETENLRQNKALCRKNNDMKDGKSLKLCLPLGFKMFLGVSVQDCTVIPP